MLNALENFLDTLAETTLKLPSSSFQAHVFKCIDALCEDFKSRLLQNFTFGSNTGSSLVPDKKCFLRSMLFGENPSEKTISQHISLLKSYKSLEKVHELQVDGYKQYDIHNFDLNIFDLSDNCPDIPMLISFSLQIFGFWDFQSALALDYTRMRNFTKIIFKGYKDPPYHNAYHAADVLQSVHILLLSPAKSPKYLLYDVEDKFALLLSAMIHDFKHPGLNNDYLNKTSHKLALRYNNISVLENYHVSQAFKIMQDSENNIFHSLVNANRIRKSIVEIVLATDMAFHNKHAEDVQEIVARPSVFNMPNMLGILMHAGDISNVCRKYHISKEWGKRISAEFEIISALENPDSPPKGLPQEESQRRFCRFVMPFYKNLASLYKTVVNWSNILEENLSMWEGHTKMTQ